MSSQSYANPQTPYWATKLDFEVVEAQLQSEVLLRPLIEPSANTVAVFDDQGTGSYPLSSNGGATLQTNVTIENGGDMANIDSIQFEQNAGIVDPRTLWLDATDTLFLGSSPVSGTSSGDVVGPVSSTDFGFVRYNGTTGKLLRDTAPGVTLSNSGVLEQLLNMKSTQVQANTINELTATNGVVVDGSKIKDGSVNLVPIASDPQSTGQTLWSNSGDSNKLYYGASPVSIGGGGGGGGGDVFSNISSVTLNSLATYANGTGKLITDKDDIQLWSGTSGNRNVIIGQKALSETGKHTGTDNTALGNNSQQQVSTGSENVSLGSNSCSFMTTGDRTVAIGHSSCQNLVSGLRNTCIGFASGLNLSGNDSNNLFLDNSGQSGDNNKIKIGREFIHDSIQLFGLEKTFTENIELFKLGYNDDTNQIVDYQTPRGYLSFSNYSIPFTINFSAATTPVKIEDPAMVFTSNYPSKFSAVNGTITYAAPLGRSPDNVKISYTVSYKSLSTGSEFGFFPAKNGTIISNTETFQRASNGVIAQANGFTITTLTNTDTLSIFVENMINSTDIEVTSFQLVVEI